MKALVLWADTRSANLGVRVLAQGMQSLLTTAFGPETDVHFQDYGPGDSEVGFGGRTIVKDLGRKHGPIKQKLSHYDLILDSGAGDSFADIYGPKRLLTMNYAHRVARTTASTLVFGPQTIGPFGSSWSRWVARSSLRSAGAVFARDTTSLEFANMLGGRAILSTDVVFALPRPEKHRAEGRDVILNVSGLLWNSDRHISGALYRSAVIETINQIRASGRSVALMAHVIDNPTDDNDVPAVHEAARIVGGDIETIIPRDLDDARAIVAHASAVVGARMHACLNALSTGTPAIPWAYSRKFAPLLSDIGWDVSLDARSTAGLPDATLRLLDSGFSTSSVEAVNSRASARLLQTTAGLQELIQRTQ